MGNRTAKAKPLKAPKLPPDGPPDAQAYIDSSFYKIGRHGFVYRWNGEEWIKSTRDADQVLRAAITK